MTQPQPHDRMALQANPRTLDRPLQPWPQPGLGFSQAEPVETSHHRPVHCPVSVDAGKFLTAAGVSAGIEMALYLAAQLTSEEWARLFKLAWNMILIHRPGESIGAKWIESNQKSWHKPWDITALRLPSNW